MAKKRTTKKAATKKTATKKTTTKKTAARRRTSAQPLNPKAGEVMIRVYRQGLGDCFLLAFGGRSPRFVLIDCGVHSRQDQGSQRLMQVMKNLCSVTKNHLHVVVATHEHADHLSGFVQKGSPFLKENLTIDLVWLAWTESRQDPKANALREKHGIAQDILEQALKKARAKANQNPGLQLLAEDVEAISSFDQFDQDAVDETAVEAAIKRLQKKFPEKANQVDPLLKQDHPHFPLLLGASKKPKTKPSSNELALGLLMMKGEATCHNPGSVLSIPDVDNARAYVLGPPRGDLLKKDRPSKIRGKHEYKETYLSSMQSGETFAYSPALETNPLGLSDHLRYPFAPEIGSRLGGNPEPDILGRYESESWRRIDGDWLKATEQLALSLDSDTNNTSLVLAFELGEPGQGPVLLFPGDAQVGNWLSWRRQDYQAGGTKVTADELMQRTLFYKVGHHGSHNATIKRDPTETTSQHEGGVPFGLELMENIIAAIPVDRDAAFPVNPITGEAAIRTPWEMPHEPLYLRLREKAHRRVLRSDLDTAPLKLTEEEFDLVPPKTAWTKVPGLPKLQWRKSSELFVNGTKGPLFYDLRIPIS